MGILSSAVHPPRQQAIDETRTKDGDGSKAIALAIIYLADVMAAKK